MSSILTTDKLIKSIKRRAFIPRDQVTFTNDDFLEMATEEITLGLMEQIITARGNYLVYHIDVPLVQGQNSYPIPSRAHGCKLREASINDRNDREQVVYDLVQIDFEDVSDLNRYGSFRSQTTFYLKNDRIIISEDVVKDNYVLRMYFYMRPNKLVMVDRGAIVNTITSATEIINGVATPVKVLAFTSLPKHFSSLLTYDIVTHESPNKIVSFSLTPVAMNLNLRTITFRSSDLREPVAVGNYITQAEETIVPNLPTEYHPIVAQRTARACLEAMNDDAGFAKSTKKLEEMEKAVLKIVTNRVEGSPKKIKQRNSPLLSGINKTNKKW
jgi:hypothetical protein